MVEGGVRGQDGQAAVEYGLIIAAIALVAIAALLFLAGGVDTLFSRASNPTGPFEPPVAACEASYPNVCVPPPPPDLDCADLEARGIPLPVKVIGSDPHNLDPDHDGLGCNED
jgi:Flp pilus assembly pilin Flp